MDIRDYLADYGISCLAQARKLDDLAVGFNGWLSALDMDIGGEWARLWTSFVKGLSLGRIRIGDSEDTILWLFDKVSGKVSANKAYELIISDLLPPPSDYVISQIWHFNIPQKLKCFIWLAFFCKINTWDNLCNRGWLGPNRCCLCKEEAESIDHLFVTCPFVREVLVHLKYLTDSRVDWSMPTLTENIINWLGYDRMPSYFPF